MEETKNPFESLEKRILYSDENFAIVTKISGEICEDVPNMLKDSKDEQYYLPVIFGKYFNTKIYCVHRLDRPVSGVCVLAKNNLGKEKLSNIFAQSGKVEKTYFAIVEGIYEASNDYTKLGSYISFNPKKQKAYSTNEPHHKSKRAELLWRSLGHGERYSFLEVQLLTGRTHQIRCQLSSIGMHIKGDLKYGAKRSDNLDGIRLHAAKISFVNPFNNCLINIESPLPQMDNLWQAFINVKIEKQ